MTGFPIIASSPDNGPPRPSSSLLAAPVTDWISLDAQVEQWTRVALAPGAAANAVALHLVGDAFLALAHERAALTEYLFVHYPPHVHRLPTLTRGLDACIQELTEACRHWTSVSYWLLRLDQESQDFLDILRPIASSMRDHARHGERLLLGVQEEQDAITRRTFLTGVQP